MNISKVFDRFCGNVSKRSGFMSEDNVRFYWFESMLDQDTDLNHYTLEAPYSSLGCKVARKELDLLYDDGKDQLCFEIKFHRSCAIKSSAAKTALAGCLFNDLYRLRHLKSVSSSKCVKCYLLYLTDQVMYDYFDHASVKSLLYKNFLNTFHSLSSSVEKFSLDPSFPKTFRENATSSLSSSMSLNLSLYCPNNYNGVCKSVSFCANREVRPYYAYLYEVVI